MSSTEGLLALSDALAMHFAALACGRVTHAIAKRNNAHNVFICGEVGCCRMVDRIMNAVAK
jgi:hypothetical protein